MYTIRKTLLHHGFLLTSTKGVSAGDQGDRDADSRHHGFLLASAKGVGAGDWKVSAAADRKVSNVGFFCFGDDDWF